MKRLTFPLVLVAALFLMIPATASAQGYVGFCSCEACAQNPWGDCSMRGVGPGPCGLYIYLFCVTGDEMAGSDLTGIATWRQPTFADLLLDAAPAAHAHDHAEVEPREQPAPEMPDAVLRETVATTAVG